MTIEYRKMKTSEISRIGEIDRSEEIQESYIYRSGTLELEENIVSARPWQLVGDGPHSVTENVADWKPYLDSGGTMLGAFDEGTLAGFAIYQPDLSPGVAQLAVLHVGLPYRRRGLGKTLTIQAIELARADGASQIYLSATPTRGTVEFYQSMGFQLADPVHPVLYELEPEDIHMTLALRA